MESRLTLRPVLMVQNNQNGIMVLDQQKMKFWTRGVLNEDKKLDYVPLDFK